VEQCDIAFIKLLTQKFQGIPNQHRREDGDDVMMLSRMFCWTHRVPSMWMKSSEVLTWCREFATRRGSRSVCLWERLWSCWCSLGSSSHLCGFKICGYSRSSTSLVP